MRIFGFVAAIVILLGAAAGLLARAGDRAAAPARPFEITTRAYDQVRVGITPVSQLQDLGFDLSRADRLSYLAMIEQFMPENSTGFDTLDPAVQGCLTARDRCAGYVFQIAGEANAKAVVVVQSGRVAYKSVTGRLLATAKAD